jgi:ATPase subunit of ABC transporter with duplicated ATPase domains
MADAAAKAWLMQFLQGFSGTVILVSHEETVLRDFRATTIAELRNQQLEIYRCDVVRAPHFVWWCGAGVDLTAVWRFDLLCGGARGLVLRSDYDGFLGQREQRLEAQQAAFERQQKEIARIQGFIDRWVGQPGSAWGEVGTDVDGWVCVWGGTGSAPRHPWPPPPTQGRRSSSGWRR